MDYEFELTDDKLLESIKFNKLDRNTRINNLLKLINIIKKNTIISIDGSWGSGKTVFVKQIELINKLFYAEGKNIGQDSSLEASIISQFNENHIVYYYNAWENDNHTSPLLSIIYKIINDFPNEKKELAMHKKTDVPINLKKFLETWSQGLIDAKKVQTFEELVDSIHTVEEQKKAFNKLLESIIPSDKKLVVIIDELDRCNPKFAIDMIETIKHFYNNNNLIFILAVNNEQLSYTISKFYGEKFDGYGYLNKIYDIIISLENVDANKYFTSVLSKATSGGYRDTIIYSLCQYYNFSMREINRYLYTMDLLYDYYNGNFDSLRDNEILKYVFIPYCLAIKVKNGKEFNNFINGKDIDSFIKLMNNSEGVKKIIEDVLDRVNKGKETKITCDEYIKETYKSFFSNISNEQYRTQQTRKMFLDAVSLISNFSSF